MARYHPVYHPPAVRFLPLTPWDELEHGLYGMNRHMRTMDQQFNSILNQFLQLNPRDGSDRPGLMRSESFIEDAISTDKDGNRNFTLKYDVSQFKPEDIKLKTKDGCLEVTAKCEEGDDSHRFYREYHRMCALPKDLNVEQLRSTYGTDGVLTIEAPLPAIEAPKPEEPMEIAKPKEPVAMQIEHHKGDAK